MLFDIGPQQIRHGNDSFQPVMVTYDRETTKLFLEENLPSSDAADIAVRDDPKEDLLVRDDGKVTNSCSAHRHYLVSCTQQRVWSHRCQRESRA